MIFFNAIKNFNAIKIRWNFRSYFIYIVIFIRIEVIITICMK